MKELLYLNKYFVKYKYSFHWVLYSQLSRKFSCFSLNLLVIRLRQLKHFQKTKTLQSVIREELIRNILLIIATTIIAGFNVLMRQTLIVMSGISNLI
jgi:ATP-binding cassette subfamily B protein